MTHQDDHREHAEEVTTSPKTDLPPESPATSDDDEGSEETQEIVSKRGVQRVLSYEEFDDAPWEPRLREAIHKLGWKTPTPIQSLCLPHAFNGSDVAGFAQTGTGKTAVFLLTIAQKILTLPERPENAIEHVCHPYAVVLSPTRELAMQITQDAEGLLNDLSIKTLAVFGGVDYEKQARILRSGVDLIVATPGRLKDYYEKGIVSLESCKVFICDEVDRMFDMGFIADVEYFMSRLPEEVPVQKLIFSATTNDDVKELAFKYLDRPEYIAANPEELTPENIEQHFVIAEAPNKLRVMLGMLQDHNPSRSIIFTNTKLTAEWLQYKLSHNGVEADLLTGDLPQRKRISLIDKIKAGNLKALIATDVASRGLHIKDITHVYNFDLPEEAANYVHRIGRTARAGAHGASYSLVCEDYGENLRGIESLLGDKYPIKCEWYDERYLQISDNAGNPFEDRMRGRRNPESEDSMSEQDNDNNQEQREGGRREHGGERGRRHGGGGHHHGRRDRHEGRHGGGGESRHEGRREGRHGGGEGRHEGRRDHRHEGQRPPREGGQGQQEHQQRFDGEGGQRGRRRRGGRGRGRDRFEPRRDQQPAAHTARPSSGVSVGGLIKRIFGAFFKKKND
jgi:ATP-dependent RNA helicase RhlB